MEPTGMITPKPRKYASVESPVIFSAAEVLRAGYSIPEAFAACYVAECGEPLDCFIVGDFGEFGEGIFKDPDAQQFSDELIAQARDAEDDPAFTPNFVLSCCKFHREGARPI
jgi:hypothetical protein